MNRIGRLPAYRQGYGHEMESAGTDPKEKVAATVGRGIAAGLAGTVVMTVFQKLVEMPLTGRGDSYAPANFAEKVLPIRPKTRPGKRVLLNYTVHFGIGAAWGATHGLAEREGLSGQRAVATVFAVIYTGDAILNVALGLYKPWRWSAQDWAIDLGEKMLLAQATGLVYERLETTSS